MSSKPSDRHRNVSPTLYCKTLNVSMPLISRLVLQRKTRKQNYKYTLYTKEKWKNLPWPHGTIHALLWDAFYDLWQGNRAGSILTARSRHWANNLYHSLNVQCGDLSAAPGPGMNVIDLVKRRRWFVERKMHSHSGSSSSCSWCHEPSRGEMSRTFNTHHW